MLARLCTCKFFTCLVVCIIHSAELQMHHVRLPMVVIGFLARTLAMSDWCRRPVDWLPTFSAAPGWPDAKRSHELGPVGMREVDIAPQSGCVNAAEARMVVHACAAYKALLLASVTARHTLFPLHHAAPRSCTHVFHRYFSLCAALSLLALTSPLSFLSRWR
jgi:hypothetical protein